MPHLTTHVLTPLQAHQLREASRLLTAITSSHWMCECELCRAKMLTDTQDAESFEAPGVRLRERESE